MKRKSGIAAIILSGAIVFAVAGDIRPVSATVSGLPAENSVSSSEYTDSSSNDLEQLKKQVLRAATYAAPPTSSEEDTSSEEMTSSLVVNTEPVVYTKEEIVEAVHRKPTEEEQKAAEQEDSQREDTPRQEIEDAPVIELPTSSAPAPEEVETPSVEESSSSAEAGSQDSSSQETSSQTPSSSSGSVSSGTTASTTPAPALGWHTINGKKYYSDGTAYLTGWQTINNRRYYFDAQGAQVSLSGIDVSTWQNGEIDWNKVKADGIDYVMIRVGFRGNSTGQLVLDNRFEQHYAGAKAAGLKIGVYFFSQSVNEQEAIDEALFTLEVLKDHPIDFPVAYDIENNANRTAGLSKQMYTNMCKAFCDTISAAGYTPQLYTYVNYTKQYLYMDQLTGYQMWIAHTGVAANAITSYSYPFVAWQYSATGTVNGMLNKDGTSASIDMNVMVPGGIEKTLSQSSSSSSQTTSSGSASTSSNAATSSDMVSSSVSSAETSSESTSAAAASSQAESTQALLEAASGTSSADTTDSE